MEKKFFNVAISLIVFLLFTNCEKKSNLEESVYFVENIKQIEDSIVKLKTYSAELVICSLRKTPHHAIITLAIYDKPYLVETGYKYREIQGVHVLFLDPNEKLTNREIPKELLKKNIIKFDGQSYNFDPPYYEFIFCENDFSSIKCFDNIMIDDIMQEYRKKRKAFSEDMLGEKCN
ncbi:hypothetical protein [Flavobacterium chungangensis]|uniref:Lipoprotein n=1 Tax=Flavobacterium chungangensis TaxID=2708132 RepID=A0ABV8ZBU5_9FLAO